MRYRLTGLSPTSQRAAPVATVTPAPATPEVTPPAATPPAAATPAIDVSKLTPEQLPQQVTLKIATEVADASGLKLKVDAGNRLKLVRIEGDQAVVSPGTSPFEGRVLISGTDLMEQLAANPSLATPNVTATDPGAPAEPATTAVTTAPEPTAITPPPAAVEPSPQEAAKPIVAVVNPADLVEVMKAHIRSGNIKEFSFEQVLEWKAEADEVIDGKTYKTGLVRYQAETIFGMKTIEAKAIIQDGTVVRWIWPKSGLEIK